MSTLHRMAQQLADSSRELFQRGASAFKLVLEAKQLKPLENGFRSHLNFLSRMIPILFHTEQTLPGVLAAREAPELLIPNIKSWKDLKSLRRENEHRRSLLEVTFSLSMEEHCLLYTTSRVVFLRKAIKTLENSPEGQFPAPLAFPNTNYNNDEL